MFRKRNMGAKVRLQQPTVAKRERCFADSADKKKGDRQLGIVVACGD
jgi:hypothetical protein